MIHEVKVEFTTEEQNAMYDYAMEHMTKRPIFHTLYDWLHNKSYSMGGKWHDRLIRSWWYRKWGSTTVEYHPNELDKMIADIQKAIDTDILKENLNAQK